MMPPGRWVKVSNEPSSSPLMARLFVGLIKLRDNLLIVGVPADKKDALQRSFGSAHRPLYDAVEAVRDAAREIVSLVSSHAEAVLSGRAIHIHGTQVDITETVNKELGQAVDKLLTQSVISTKTCLQQIMTDPLGLDIGFLFQNGPDFDRGIEGLRTAGEHAFADYLCAVRNTWHEDIQELRRQIEHEGWTLDTVRYPSSKERPAIPVFPLVLGQPVDQFAATTANRVLTFVEESVVYAIQRRHHGPVMVVEVPSELRSPDDPARFRLDVGRRPSPREWNPQYREGFDFVKPVA